MARPKKKAAKPAKRKYVRRVVGQQTNVRINPKTYARDGDTVKDGFATINYGGNLKALKAIGAERDYVLQGDEASILPNATMMIGGSASPGPNYYQTKPHVRDLHEAFPGIWVRADGAFTLTNMNWYPSGKAPAMGYSEYRRNETNPQHGPSVSIKADTELTLKQLNALVRYIREESGFV